MAYFTVVVPTKNRHQFVGECVRSVLAQSWRDFEVIVSDNWNDERTAHALQTIDDERFRIVRPPREMNMPDHWEFASQQGTGSYVIFLNDRMLMRPGALALVAGELCRAKEPDVCAWSFQTFVEATRALLPHDLTGRIDVVPSREILDDFLNDRRPLWRRLPRMVNAGVRRSFLDGLRRRFGPVFTPTSPDYTCALMFLATTPAVLYIDRPLLVVRGEEHSTGTRSQTERTASPYMRSIGDVDPVSHVPMKAFLVWNSVYNDYLTVMDRVRSEFAAPPLDWNAYFGACVDEIRIVERAVPRADLREVWQEWRRAAAQMGVDADAMLKERRAREGLLQRVKDVVRPVGVAPIVRRAQTQLAALRLRVRREPRFESAFEAASRTDELVWSPS